MQREFLFVIAKRYSAGGMIFLTILSLVLLNGCAEISMGNKELLGFLQDGVTTREEIYLRLAEPNAIFEDSKILTYRLDEDESGYILLKSKTKGWTGKYSLVLAFDEHGVLRRHALIQIKQQYQD